MSGNPEQQPDSSQNAHLENMFNRAKPRSRYMSETHVEDETNAIAQSITDGQIKIGRVQSSLNSPTEKHDEIIRKKLQRHIENQKRRLQDKLGEIEHSLTALHGVSQSSTLRRKDVPAHHDNWRKEHNLEVQRLKEKQRQIRERENERLKQSQQVEERVKQEQALKKKQQIAEHLRKIKERTQLRESKSRHENEKLREVLHRKELHERFAESYRDKEDSMLDERKRKLAEIRMLRQPISPEEIKDHEQRFIELKKQKDQLRSRERKMNDSRGRIYKASYESAFYRQIADSVADQSPDTSKLKLQKMKQFSDHVKNKFAPEIDERKRRQLEEQREKEEEEARRKEEREKQLSEKSRQKGLQYLSLLKNLPRRSESQKDANRSNVSSTSPSTDRIQYTNYLGMNRDSEVPNKPWKTILNYKGDKTETALMLQIESEKVEERLRRKEVYAKVLKIKDDGSIDQEYYDMVKAKLDLLGKQ